MFNNHQNHIKAFRAFLLLLFCLGLHGHALAATAIWEDERESLLRNPQTGRLYRSGTAEADFQPLPALSQTAQQDPLDISWTLRLITLPDIPVPGEVGEPGGVSEPNFSVPVDADDQDSQAQNGGIPLGSEFSDAGDQAAEGAATGGLEALEDAAPGADALLRPASYPEWLGSGPLWLFVRVENKEAGNYFYAPFASGQSAQDRAESAGAVLPTSLEIIGPDGEALPGVEFYYPPGSLKEDPYSGLRLPVYSEETLIVARVPSRLLGQDMRLKINALICSDVSCTPFRKALPLVLGPASITAEPLEPGLAVALMDYRAAPFDEPEAAESLESLNDAAAGLETASEATGGEEDFASYLGGLSPSYHAQSLEVTNIWRAILLGLLAGVILNFMPCVLPVITLKLGTLVGLGGWSSLEREDDFARASRRRLRIYGLCFSLGVFVWFCLLFAVIGFAGLIWGQFFQSQKLVLGLAILLFVMALSMFGLVRIPLLNIQVGNKAGLPWQAFFGGLLATLLATPCSGPLLGGVLGWAVSQSLPYLGITLFSVALGMSLPFIVLVISPGLARYLPKPGPWTRSLEVVMGFLLMATVIYLLSMLPGGKLFVALGALLAIAFAAWLWSHSAARGKRFGLARVLAIVLFAGAVWYPYTYKVVDTSWKTFDAASFQELVGKKNILLDFTADWCINCRAMEATTLTEQRLLRWGRNYDLVFMKVDLTAENPDGQALLGALGSASIPLLAIIPADAPDQPTVLRDLVTPRQLNNALKQALR